MVSNNSKLPGFPNLTFKWDSYIRKQALEKRIYFMHYSTGYFTKLSLCVIRLFSVYCLYFFQHKLKKKKILIESCCTFTELFNFWTAIAPKNSDLQFRKHLEAIIIWTSTIEKTLIQVQHNQVRLSSYPRLVHDCLAFVPWKLWQSFLHKKAGNNISSIKKHNRMQGKKIWLQIIQK